MKTKKTQSRLSPWLVAIVLFLSSTPVLNCQELIRGTDEYVLCDTSIVRQISTDSTLIYFYSNKPTLSLVLSGSTNTKTMYIDSTLVINDFELLNKMVYFCGYKRENGVKKAIVGAVSLFSFPTYHPYYYVIPSCEEMKKIDVFKFEYQLLEEIHMVMTGTTGTRSDVLAEIFSNTINGDNCKIYLSNDETENIDDVAVTKNSVVISVRKEMEGLPVIDFWQFSKPTMTGSFVIDAYYNRFRIASPIAETPVFLEHTTTDNFAAVCKVSSFSRMAMLKPDLSNLSCQIVEIFGSDDQIIFPIDIKYSRQSKIYDILAREYVVRYPGYDPKMKIYHISPAVMGNQVTYGDGTEYTDHFVWSIDPAQGGYYSQFVASGGYGFGPRLFRYWYNQWNNCPEYFNYPFDIGIQKITRMEEKLTLLNCFIKAKSATSRRHDIPFPVICEEN